MGRCYRARCRIKEEDRQAVRGHNRKRESSFTGNERIALGGALSGILSPENIGAVYLGYVNRIGRESEFTDGNRAVLQYKIPVIADMEREVEAPIAAGAHPALSQRVPGMDKGRNVPACADEARLSHRHTLRDARRGRASAPRRAH